MEATLDAIAGRQDLALQIIATGMHLDTTRGATLHQIRKAGWRVDATVPWNHQQGTPAQVAAATARAMARLVPLYQHLRSDIVLVVGDRVEAFAAAAAAHLAGQIVAHVHGGDRALGQVDDTLRHAISKLAHLHFAATAQSARRLRRLGEDPWRIHHVGSPGLDRIQQLAASAGQLAQWLARAGFDPPARPYALLVVHPETPDAARERRHAAMLPRLIRQAGFNQTIGVYPNTDPGAAGILHAWKVHKANQPLIFLPSAPREIYLGLLRDAAILVGNSSSGIIEAATFGTPVLDIGQRQQGRQRSANVVNVPWTAAAIRHALQKAWNNGHPRRSRAKNVYGDGAADRIADILGRIPLDQRLRHKLIAY